MKNFGKRYIKYTVSAGWFR